MNTILVLFFFLIPVLKGTYNSANFWISSDGIDDKEYLCSRIHPCKTMEFVEQMLLEKYSTLDAIFSINNLTIQRYLIQEGNSTAQKIIHLAEEKAERILKDANDSAREIINNTNKKAERIILEAGVLAQRKIDDAMEQIQILSSSSQQVAVMDSLEYRDKMKRTIIQNMSDNSTIFLWIIITFLAILLLASVLYTRSLVLKDQITLEAMKNR